MKLYYFVNLVLNFIILREEEEKFSSLLQYLDCEVWTCIVGSTTTGKKVKAENQQENKFLIIFFER